MKKLNPIAARFYEQCRACICMARKHPDVREFWLVSARTWRMLAREARRNGRTK